MRLFQSSFNARIRRIFLEFFCLYKRLWTTNNASKKIFTCKNLSFYQIQIIYNNVVSSDFKFQGLIAYMKVKSLKSNVFFLLFVVVEKPPKS